MTSIRFIWVTLNLCLYVFFIFSALNYQTVIYLVYQAKGQLSILLNTQSLVSFEKENKLSERVKTNILLTKQIKNYSVDSLSFKPTNNYTTVFDQKGNPVLWVITACEPYTLRPYKWNFPVVGKVSYKGFFEKDLAKIEFNHMAAQGYDVDLRSVSAWSTLGWFNDPILSSMLARSKGGLCNLLFHELFHATYYAPNSVDLNENLAGFIAHKATLKFLEKDTASLREYKENHQDNRTFSNYMMRRINFLGLYYKKIDRLPNKHALKLTAIFQIADSIEKLPLVNKGRFRSRKEDILKYKNAYFVDFIQYDSMQDSLEGVFNKIYRANIEKMVQDLKLN